MSVDPGPYISEGGEGDGLYYPVEAWPYQLARRDAVSMAKLAFGEIGRTKVLGIRDVALWDDEKGPMPEGHPLTRCYVFEQYEQGEPW